MPSLRGPVIGPGLVELNREDAMPLHEQIERSLREAIRDGRLPAGSPLPSTRALAAELGISRGVVTEAYGQLAVEGYLTTRQGAPVRVATAVRPAARRPPAQSMLASFAYHFDPGCPDLAGFPRDRWLRSLRFAWKQAPLDAVGQPDPRGQPALREALADYGGRVRGAVADAEQVMICSGFSQGLALICRWLHSHGVRRVALEDPGWHRHRLIVEAAGLEVAPIPVDDDGLLVEALEESGVSAVVVTPAHQFPTGVILSSERRAALIEWAERGERLIVEDDYDSELRYDGPVVGALQGLAPERVAYVGSASKRLVPGMRLGWMLAPSWLGWSLISSKAVEDGGAEAIGQLALAEFIARGELDRHVRRMRMRYRGRREALLGSLARHLPQARVGEAAAGLFELVLLGEEDEARVVSAAAERGVGVEPLSLHRFRPGGGAGLVLGFGGMAEPTIERAVRLLAEAVRD